ncbi:hypothetical protein Tco_0452052 [Tanacetum coccineum]
MGFTCESKAEIWVTKGLLNEAKEIILSMEIFRTRSGNTLRVLRFRFSNGMSVQILLGRHSMLSLEGGLSENRDEERKSKGSCIYALGSHVYQIVCTRPDIASADVVYPGSTKEKYSLVTSAELARAKPDMHSGEALMLKDRSGPESLVPCRGSRT